MKAKWTYLEFASGGPWWVGRVFGSAEWWACDLAWWRFPFPSCSPYLRVKAYTHREIVEEVRNHRGHHHTTIGPQVSRRDLRQPLHYPSTRTQTSCTPHPIQRNRDWWWAQVWWGRTLNLEGTSKQVKPLDGTSDLKGANWHCVLLAENNSLEKALVLRLSISRRCCTRDCSLQRASGPADWFCSERPGRGCWGRRPPAVHENATEDDAFCKVKKHKR